MKNVITIELCAEDRARLDAILGALQAGPNCESCVKSAIDFVANQQVPEEASPAEAPGQLAIPEEPAPVEVPEPQPEVVKVERSDIQKKVVELSQAGKKNEVKAIVTAYNNTKVSDIPEDKLDEVMAKLNELEG